MPIKAAKAPLRGKRTKAEVQEKFAAIQEDVEAEREAADAKREEAARLREAETRAAVDGITVDGVVQRISGLGLEVSKALANVSDKLVQEVNLLASVREAVELERKDLERLHKIDVAATALGLGGRDGARRARAQGAGRESAQTAPARDRR